MDAPPPAPTTEAAAKLKDEDCVEAASPKDSGPAAALAAAAADDDDGPARKVSRSEPLLVPKAAVKRVMKLDADVNQVANDAVILVAKATELFLAKLAKSAQAQSTNAQRAISYDDVAQARCADDNLLFLESVLALAPAAAPPSAPIEDAPPRLLDAKPAKGLPPPVGESVAPQPPAAPKQPPAPPKTEVSKME
ncbi:hypothetical protein M885DRAFT_541893 [Pelagophyceae sp. CCMP2097]|nr:hypothetical protein M885DRAFT_541893 [Pelagophyceae sp. CCMP2097]